MIIIHPQCTRHIRWTDILVLGEWTAKFDINPAYVLKLTSSFLMSYFRNLRYRHSVPASYQHRRFTPSSTLGGGDHAGAFVDYTPSRNLAMYSPSENSSKIQIPPGSYITLPGNMSPSITKGQAVSPLEQGKAGRGYTTSPQNYTTSPSKVLIYRIFSRY